MFLSLDGFLIGAIIAQIARFSRTQTLKIEVVWNEAA
jgi:hypothetical protein